MKTDQEPEVVLEQSQKIMLNRGKARIQLSHLKMLELGFGFGQSISIEVSEGAVHIRPGGSGQRTVARVKNHGKYLPTIDLKQTSKLDLSTLGEIGEQVTVRYQMNLLSILRAQPSRARVAFRSLPSGLGREAIEKALDRIDRDGIEPHGRNTTYAVVARDRMYPPLAVAAFAIEADGHAPVPAGGLRGERNSPAFRLLLDAGCEIVRLDERGDEQDRLERETDRGQRPPAAEIGSYKPLARTRTGVVEFTRDKWVVRLVLDRAKGICECCEEPAPFKKRRGGEPYLEVHHVVPLSEGGPDTIDNAVAICPNCHARCHQGEDHRKATERLYENVPTLKRPLP